MLHNESKPTVAALVVIAAFVVIVAMASCAGSLIVTLLR